MTVLRPPYAPASSDFTVAEAREVLAALHSGFAVIPSRRVPFQRAGFFDDAPPEPPPAWARKLWQDYRSRYGTFLLPAPQELAASRLRLALLLSVRSMPAGLAEAAWELFTDPKLYVGIMAGLAFYVVAWLAPEPVFTKATAILITYTLLLTFAAAEIYNAANVLWRLYTAAQSARTLAEVEAAAEQFGRAVSGTLLRILVVIASRYAGKALPKVPEGGLRALRWEMVETQGGAALLSGRITLTITTATVTADGTMLMAGAVAGTAAGSLCADKPGGTYKGHHIATDKNEVSTARGGPWTQRFEDLFAKANMTLDDPANMVNVAGHSGPHPEEYHKEVYERLSKAMSPCRGSVMCQKVMVNELKRIAAEICTPGSQLNRLLTKG